MNTPAGRPVSRADGFGLGLIATGAVSRALLLAHALCGRPGYPAHVRFVT